MTNIPVTAHAHPNSAQRTKKQPPTFRSNPKHVIFEREKLISGAIFRNLALNQPL